MKKTLVGLLTALAVIGMTGCDTGVGTLGEVTLSQKSVDGETNSTVVGYTSTIGQYEGVGAKLYNGGKEVGFITSDGLVFGTPSYRHDGVDYCGGEVYGFCKGGEFEDGVLISDCVVEVELLNPNIGFAYWTPFRCDTGL